MPESLLEIPGTNTDTLIIAFGGCALSFGGIPPFEFVRSFKQWFPNYNMKFYIDKDQSWYHKGIKGITTNIHETVLYLQEIIKPYKRVIFIGTSAGGYASILFGSLLKISIVIAFIPQTILTRSDTEFKYRNLKEIINSSTDYYVYGCPAAKDELHHISHVENLSNFQNVKIIRKNVFNIKTMRDNGELIENIIRSLEQVQIVHRNSLESGYLD